MLRSLANANRRVTLRPQLPLAASTLYTLTIGGIEDSSGIQDLAGNGYTGGRFASTFTAGP